MKILKNTTSSSIFISDTGVNLLPNSDYTVPATEYPLMAASSDLITWIGNGSIIVSDGTFDLSKADAVALIQGNFKQSDFIEDLKNNNRLKVEVLNAGGPTIQVTGNDQTSGYLGQKLVAKIGETETSVLNPSGNEALEVGLADSGVTPGTYGSATQVPQLTIDDKGRTTVASNISISIPSTQVNDFTEAAQDAVGSILIDTSSVNFTYDDSGNQITAAVLPAGVDHNSLANLTSGDPHTQYVKDAGTVTDNAVTRYDGTDGRTIQNSDVYITDDGFMGVKAAVPMSELEVRSTRSVSNRGISTTQYSNDLQGAKVTLAKARGTPSAPLYPQNDDIIGLNNFKAWDEATASWVNVGYYNVHASETHTATAKGTDIGFWTTANGTTTPTEKVQITNTGRVVLTNAITLSNTSETADGTFRWTGSEAQVRNGSEWKVLGGTKTTITSAVSASTTSNTYTIIPSMSVTPIAGTYEVSFNANVSLGDDTSGDISIFIGGTEQTLLTRRLAINATGVLGAVANYEVVFSTQATVTLNGSQQIDVRYRENSNGTLTVTERILELTPIARPS